MIDVSLEQAHALANVARLASVLMVTSSVIACVGAVDSDIDEDLGATQQAMTSENGLAWNGLTMNGLTMNGLTMNGLTMNGLTMNGLILGSGAGITLATDALARKFMSYVVGCALPEGQSVTVGAYTYHGSIGVAPAWGVEGGSCDTTCQQWVSACVLSRVNALGVNVPLSVRGNNAALSVGGPERSMFGRREATYFGNLFTTPPARFACRAATDDQALIGRPCGAGSDVSSCIITVLGDCNSVCVDKDPTDGYFDSCTAPSKGTFGPTVTVFRQ